MTGLLSCAMAILRDECPDDRRFYLCMMGEEGDEYADTPGGPCARCWENYLLNVANHGHYDVYRYDRVREGREG